MERDEIIEKTSKLTTKEVTIYSSSYEYCIRKS